MRCCSRLIAAVLFCAGSAALAQLPTYHVGRAPTPEEVNAWDIAIGPEGKELPPGSGTAKEGAHIYAQRCSRCHGADLKGGQLAPPLVGGKGTLTSARPLKTIGSYWPFATTVFDYVNRTMPWKEGGSLKPSELYAVTAFLLYKNEIVQENEVIDAQSLPKVRMPNRDGFVPTNPEWKARGKRSPVP